MKASCAEGPASHGDPESCVRTRACTNDLLVAPLHEDEVPVLHDMAEFPVGPRIIPLLTIGSRRTRTVIGGSAVPTFPLAGSLWEL